MDNLETRKWFVYIGDHHEGPFTVQEISEKVQTGVIGAQQYVWCEGMADWQLMQDLPEFSASPAGGPTSQAAQPTEIAPEFLVEPVHDSFSDPGKHPPVHESLSPADAPTEPSIEIKSPAPGFVHEVEQPKTASRPLRMKKKIPRARIAGVLVALTVLGLGVWLYTQGLADPKSLKARWEQSLDGVRPRIILLIQKFPLLSKFVSPLPNLPDVSPEELAELKAAVVHSLAAGPRVAIALARQSTSMPVFYIATNLPEGTRFDIVVRGIPDTLLNQLEFMSQSRATVSERIAKTQPLRTKDGRPVPLGDFTVLVYESETQPEPTQAALQSLQPVDPTDPSIPKGVKIVSTKQYFLGGAPSKDEQYLTRLKSFHDKLRQRATDELNELKQFSSTLMSQYEDSVKNFRKHKKIPPPKSNRKAWNSFAPKWQKLQGNLNKEFSKWTADILKSDYFYSSIYALTKNAGEIVGKIHQMHHAYFNQKVDVKSFQIQLGALESDGERALTMLREKIIQAENLQPTPSGMPRREGL